MQVVSSTARPIARATSSPVRGWAGWPLTTTGQPAASAEAVSPPAVEKASGKLLAPKTATGPSGIWRCRMSARGSGVRSGRAGRCGRRDGRRAGRRRRTSAAGRWCGRPRPRCGPAAGCSRRRPPRRSRPCRPRSRRRRRRGTRRAARGWWRGRSRTPRRPRWSRRRRRPRAVAGAGDDRAGLLSGAGHAVLSVVVGSVETVRRCGRSGRGARRPPSRAGRSAAAGPGRRGGRWRPGRP